ncbi:MAG TPA: hypothetical protein VGM88_14420 [Kofleriaceae bacterium]|jgi:hypothetical protein
MWGYAEGNAVAVGAVVALVAIAAIAFVVRRALQARAERKRQGPR